MSGQLNEFECMGFHELLPKGKASGTMRVHEHKIVFEIDSQIFQAPLQSLQVSLGGASNRLVFFKHPHLHGWSFYTSDLAILNNSYLLNQPAIAATLMQAKRKRVTGWSVIAVALVLVVAIPLLLILRMDILTGIVAKKIPVEWEQQLGDSAVAQYQLGKNFMTPKKAEQLLLPFTEPLIKALENSPYEYQFHIVNDGSLNAFALPGGEIVIHSALILRADSAEELAGVLAHEIMHVEQQHGLRGVIGAAGIYLTASAVFGDVSGILATLSSAAPLLLNQSYSRRFETESDLKGFALLQAARINPAGLASFFDKMIEEEKRLLESIESEENRELIKGALQFLSTHPASEDRIETLKDLHASSNASGGDYLDLTTEFFTLQEAVKQFVTDHEEEEADEN